MPVRPGWEQPRGTNLRRACGDPRAGAITQSLLRLLAPFGCDTTVVRRRPDVVEGTSRTVALDDLDQWLPGADLVVLALGAHRRDPEGVFDRHRLRLLPPHTWIVNVARGRHIVTDDLVEVLTPGAMGPRRST